MSEASKTFGRAAREMKESVSDLRKAYASESEKSRTMFEEQIKSLGSGLNAAIEEFAKQADGMARSVDRLATSSTAASQGIVDATESLGTGLVSMEKNLDSSLANMKNEVRQLNVIMGNVAKYANSANDINGRLALSFETERDASNAIAGSVLSSGKQTIDSIKELHKLIEERVLAAQHATITASALEDALKVLEARLTEIRQSSSAAGEVGEKTLGVAEQLVRSVAPDPGMRLIAQDVAQSVVRIETGLKDLSRAMLAHQASIDAALQAASSASARPAEGP
jgi:septation ring formation regulator EzrA